MRPVPRDGCVWAGRALIIVGVPPASRPLQVLLRLSGAARRGVLLRVGWGGAGRSAVWRVGDLGSELQPAAAGHSEIAG